MRVEAFYHDERAWAVPAHLFDRRIRRTSKPDAAARCQCGRRRCSAPPRLRTQPPKKARRRDGRGEEDHPSRESRVFACFAPWEEVARALNLLSLRSPPLRVQSLQTQLKTNSHGPSVTPPKQIVAVSSRRHALSRALPVHRRWVATTGFVGNRAPAPLFSAGGRFLTINT